MNAEIYDLAIIGGGPAGYSAAILAAKQNKRVILFEKQKIGGTCLNVGCIPTKFLLEKASVFEQMRHLYEHKIIDQVGRFSLKKIQQVKQDAINSLVSGVQSLLKSLQVTLIDGEAAFFEKGIIHCGNHEYKFRNVLIATGSEWWLPEITGSQGNVIDSTTALALEKVPASVAIIGGGVIGLEFASIYSSYGSKVYILEVLDEILFREDKDAVMALKKILTTKGIQFFTGIKNIEISKKDGQKWITFENKHEKEQMRVDCIIGATGRKPSLRGIDVEKLSLKTDIKKGTIIVDDHMRTNLEGVYAAGDVIGGWQLAHAAYREAEIAVDAIFGQGLSRGEEPMPRCVYTLPPLASVGMTIQETESAGRSTVVGKFTFAANGMALAKDAKDGAIWVISDKETHEILGVHIVGTEAPELISTAAMAIATRATVDQWSEMIVAHPTLSEIAHEAAMSCVGKAIHRV